MLCTYNWIYAVLIKYGTIEFLHTNQFSLIAYHVYSSIVANITETLNDKPFTFHSGLHANTLHPAFMLQEEPGGQLEPLYQSNRSDRGCRRDAMACP